MSIRLVCAIGVVCASVAVSAPRASEAQWPLVFEANRGQAGAEVRFVARRGASSLLLDADSAVLRLPAGEIRMSLPGAARAQAIEGLDLLPGTSSYYMGDDRVQWRSGIPQYGRVRYRGVYPGIDLIFYGGGSGFEYDFVVAPGADPSAIRVRFQGADSVTADAAGALELRSGDDVIRQPRPQVYQELAGGRSQIPARMVLGKGNIARFRLGAYDHTRPLVIDPLVKYFISSPHGDDELNAIGMDNAGNVYVTGYTNSSGFPKTGGFGTPVAGQYHVFVGKISSDMKTVLYSVILGGSSTDQANAIAVDGAGNTYVTGATNSQDFPHVNAAQNNYGLKLLVDPTKASDVFIFKLDPKGALVYSTFLGGDATDFANAIAVDKSGVAYVTGGSDSVRFPVTTGAFNIPIVNIGGSDQQNVIFAKLSPDGASFAYVGRFGGSQVSLGNAIAVDSGGNAYLAGVILAGGQADFPTTGNVIQRSRPGCPTCSTSFVAKLNAAGSGLVFSTYFGGKGTDLINGMTLDNTGNIYIAGQTTSPDLPVSAGVVVPKIRAGDTSSNGFVAALNNSGSAVVACSYLGGLAGTGIVLLPQGGIGISGFTDGDFAGFPASAKPAGPVYVQLDPLFQNASNTYTDLLDLYYQGVAASADGSVALGGNSSPFSPPSTTGTAAPRIFEGPRVGGTYVMVTKLPATATPPPPTGGLSLSAAASASSVPAGSSFTYSFTIKNTLTTAAANMRLAATFSGSAVQLTGASISAGSCPALPSPATSLSCTSASVAAGASVVLTVQGTALAVGSALAVATLTWDNGTAQSAQTVINVVAPAGSLQFASAVGKAVAAGTPVAVAIANQTVFVLTSSIESYQGKSLTPQPPIALGAGASPAGLVLSAGSPIVLDHAGNVTAYVSGVAVQSFAANPNPTGMTTLNLSGNGSVDLAVIGDSGIALFTANGDGTFTPGAVFDIDGRQGQLPAVAAGSFTGAGLDDLVVSDAGGNIWLLPSDGMGGFGSPLQATAGSNSVALAVGDFNGDGNLDVAVANSGSGNVSLLLGDGAGDLAAGATLTVGPNPVALSAADFNSDGNLDLAVVVSGANSLALLMGTGGGNFQAPVPYLVGTQPVALVVGDVEGNGKPDIVVANRGTKDFSVIANQN